MSRSFAPILLLALGLGIAFTPDAMADKSVDWSQYIEEPGARTAPLKSAPVDLVGEEPAPAPMKATKAKSTKPTKAKAKKRGVESRAKSKRARGKR